MVFRRLARFLEHWVSLIEDKMGETSLRLFSHGHRRLIGATVRKVDCLEVTGIAIVMERPKET